jgi:hypothetical protein
MKPIERLRAFLFEPPQMSLLRYALIAFAVSYLPGIALAGAGILSAEILGYDSSKLMGRDYSANLADFVLLVIGAPVLETLLLAFLMGILSRMFKRDIVIVTLSAVIWGALHGISGPLLFLPTAWAFFVFSSAFLVWKRKSIRAGLIAAAIPHALLNSMAMWFLLTSTFGDGV